MKRTLLAGTVAISAVLVAGSPVAAQSNQPQVAQTLEAEGMNVFRSRSRTQEDPVTGNIRVRERTLGVGPEGPSRSREETITSSGDDATVLRQRSETRGDGTRSRSESRFDPLTGETRERFETRTSTTRDRSETRFNPVTGETRVRTRTRSLDEHGNVVRTRSEIRYDSDGNVIRERNRTTSDRSGSSRDARVERASRSERAERAERPERPSRPERAERPERPSRPERPERTSRN